MAKLNAKSHTAGKGNNAKNKEQQGVAGESAADKEFRLKGAPRIPYVGPIIETYNKTDPEKSVKLIQFAKKLAIVGLVLILAITVAVTFFTFAGMAAPLTPILALMGSSSDTSGGQNKVDFGIKPEDFYGVRVFYENDTLAREELTLTYNALVYEVLLEYGNNLNTSPAINQVVASNRFNAREQTAITPEGILPDDFFEKQENTHVLVSQITNQVIFIMYQSAVLQNVAENAEYEAPVPTDTFDLNNINIYFDTIDHFGFTKVEFDLIIQYLQTTIPDVLKNVIVDDLKQADVALKQNYVVLKESKTLSDFEALDFTNILENLEENESLEVFKTVSDKLFVKDLILKEEESSEETDTIIDGNAVYYIYMPRTTVQMAINTYKCKIENDSSWKVNIGYFDYAQDATTFASLHEVIVDKSYFGVVESEAISTGGEKVYKEIIDVNNLDDMGNINQFEAIDETNEKALNKDGISLFDLGALQNFEIYAQKQTVDGEDGFSILNYLPQQKCMGVTFTPENIAGLTDTFLFGEFGACLYSADRENNNN